MNNRYTITEFRNDYPDNDACLHKLFTLRFTGLVCPKCDGQKEFTRVSKKKSYQCPSCGFQVYPMAGTIFEKSTTPLTHWYYAIYLQTTTRNGVAAKELERQLNICYKTALRMAHQIKRLMANNKGEKITGICEIDEMYWGQSIRTMTKKQKKKWMDENKTVMDNKTGIMAFISRDGQIRTEVMNDARSFKERVRDNVSKEATIVTDSHLGYVGLNIEFFKHETVNHFIGEYKRDEWHVNTVESFWSQLRRCIAGTHIHVDAKYLQLYAGEVAFRIMHRKQQSDMFDAILRNVV